MKKKLITSFAAISSIFSATAFGKTMFSEGSKFFLGGSLTSSSIQLTPPFRDIGNVQSLGAGITGGYVFEVGNNNLIIDFNIDAPITKSSINISDPDDPVEHKIEYKSNLGFSLGLKYAINVFENAKGYVGISLHQRQYELNAMGYGVKKSMMHIAAVLGMEAKVAEKVGFFGELHYFVAGGKSLIDDAPSGENTKIDKGNVIKVGGRYYF